jgi:hypothetical protein
MQKQIGNPSDGTKTVLDTKKQTAIGPNILAHFTYGLFLGQTQKDKTLTRQSYSWEKHRKISHS